MKDQDDILNKIVNMLINAGFKIDDCTTDNQRLIKERDAEKYLGISKRGFQKLVKAGHIKRIVIGPKTIRYDRVELNLFISNHRDNTYSSAS